MRPFLTGFANELMKLGAFTQGSRPLPASQDQGQGAFSRQNLQGRSTYTPTAHVMKQRGVKGSPPDTTPMPMVPLASRFMRGE